MDDVTRDIFDDIMHFDMTHLYSTNEFHACAHFRFVIVQERLTYIYPDEGPVLVSLRLQYLYTLWAYRVWPMAVIFQVFIIKVTMGVLVQRSQKPDSG